MHFPGALEWDMSTVKAGIGSSAGTRRWTYNELLAQFKESNQPCELWDGELVMAPAPFYQHQRIAFRLHRALHDWVEQHGLGEGVGAPIDMVLAPHRVVQPDVVYIERKNLGIVQDAIRGAADLVIEIISAGSGQRDRVDKKALYEQYGVQEYWIVDPELQTVEVFRLDPNQRYRVAGKYS